MSSTLTIPAQNTGSAYLRAAVYWAEGRMGEHAASSPRLCRGNKFTYIDP